MLKDGKRKGQHNLYFHVHLNLDNRVNNFPHRRAKNNRIKFHSLQAIFLGITAIVLDLILFFVPFLGPFLVFLIWVYGMYIAIKAYNGEDVKAPVIGDYAAKYSGYTP